MDFEIILISLPVIALAVLFSTRADPVTTEAMTKARENLAIKFKVIISSIIAPVMILVMNSSWSVFFDGSWINDDFSGEIIHGAFVVEQLNSQSIWIHLFSCGYFVVYKHLTSHCIRPLMYRLNSSGSVYHEI